jgi:hypothetical protein
MASKKEEAIAWKLLLRTEPITAYVVLRSQNIRDGQKITIGYDAYTNYPAPKWSRLYDKPILAVGEIVKYMKGIC